MKLRNCFTVMLLLSVLAGCGGPAAPKAAPTAEGAAEPTTATTATAPPTASAAAEPTTAAPAAEPMAVVGPVVDTGQSACYDTAGQPTECAGSGQDAAYSGAQPSYTPHGDGTVTDNVTGLTWQQSPDLNDDGTIDAADKLTLADAEAFVNTLVLGGYDDWRLPTITELYSLIDFDGIDPSGYNGTSTDGLVPFIDIAVFEFGYGDTAAGERIIDAQFASSTRYVSTTMNGDPTLFGVNFGDGRIKGYPITTPGGKETTFYILAVRGNTYGAHDYVDNGDGTVYDAVTGLTWMQADSGTGLDWPAAIAYCETLELGGSDDWRLPNAKELQHLVDYSLSPDTSNSAAIAPIFDVTPITNEAGQSDFGVYWTGTTHLNVNQAGANAAYVSFGRAMGNMNSSWLDVHGAGAQRSERKVGDPAEWSDGHGPQGDAVRIYNMVRCVSDGAAGVADGTTGAAPVAAADLAAPVPAATIDA